eukprot:9468378-Pyramimonas_sp.AAC.1
MSAPAQFFRPSMSSLVKAEGGERDSAVSAEELYDLMLLDRSVKFAEDLGQLEPLGGRARPSRPFVSSRSHEDAEVLGRRLNLEEGPIGVDVSKSAFDAVGQVGRGNGPVGGQDAFAWLDVKVSILSNRKEVRSQSFNVT